MATEKGSSPLRSKDQGVREEEIEESLISLMCKSMFLILFGAEWPPGIADFKF